MRFKIDRVNLIVGSKFTVFALSFFVFEGNFQLKAPPGGGAYIWKSDLTEGCLRYEFRGLYTEGLSFGVLRYLVCVSLEISTNPLLLVQGT